MKKQRDIDFKRLIEKTFDFLNSRNLSPDELQGSARGIDNIWGQLCIEIFGEYSLKDSIYLYSAWKRNMQLFQSKVKDRFFSNNENTTNIPIIPNEIEMLQSMIQTFSNGRKCFSSEFAKFISMKIKASGVNCWLKCNYNWFQKDKKRKNYVFWNGKYSCIECKNIFKTSFEDKSMKILKVEKFFFKNNQHGLLPEPKLRIVAGKRKQLAEEIISKGISNFRAENFLTTNYYTKIRKISSEFTHRFRLFNELRVDCEAIKNAFDLLLAQTNQNGIKGFIQEVSLNPFKMTLVSEIQIRMWDTIQKRNPVWHFDASGLFLNELNDQSKPYLFSIVCYDPLSRSIIPISDFFSTANDGLSIQLNLMRIQNIFNKYKNTYNPSIIVTDFSWANIHAILRTFLNCDILQYLKICFQKVILFNSSYDSVLKTKLYLCSTHFLKNIIDELDHKKNLKNKISLRARTCFIFCFTMLQNSKSIFEFDENLFHFYNIFSQPRLNGSLLKSLLKMQIEIKTRNVDWLKNAFQFKDRSYLNKDKELRKEVVFANDFSDNYRRDSPFTKYFDEKLKNFKCLLTQDANELNECLNDNEYYFPHLMHIVYKRLHLVPLWSGIMISNDSKNFPYKKNLNRLTNNTVEAWFGFFRNNVLKINKRVRLIRRLNPSEIVTPYYNYLLMKFKQHYIDSCIDFSQIDTTYSRNKTIDLKESWDFTAFRQAERKKGVYLSNKFNFNVEIGEINKKTGESFGFHKYGNLMSIECINYDKYKSNKNESKIEDFIYILIYGEKILFKDIYQLLNGEMINDYVIFLFQYASNLKLLNLGDRYVYEFTRTES